MDCITVYGTVGRGSIPRWGTLIVDQKIWPSGGTVYTRLSKSRAHGIESSNLSLATVVNSLDKQLSLIHI